MQKPHHANEKYTFFHKPPCPKSGVKTVKKLINTISIFKLSINCPRNSQKSTVIVLDTHWKKRTKTKNQITVKMHCY